MKSTAYRIERTDLVTLDPEAHIYTHRAGYTMESVTRVLKSVQEPFNSDRISYFVARKKLRHEIGGGNWKVGMREPTEEQIKRKQAEVLLEWDDKRELSIEHGVGIHSIVEDILSGKGVVEEHSELAMIISSAYFNYKQVLPEFILFDEQYGVAGMTDNVALRQASPSSLVDIDDFKTNISKGIQFDSMGLDERGNIRHYNRMLLPPVSHLEDCNYNLYCLQLSIYAYLFEKRYKHGIGSLRIRFIYRENVGNGKHKYAMTTYPVPYMRSEAIAILENYSQLKELPARKEEIEIGSMVASDL